MWRRTLTTGWVSDVLYGAVGVHTEEEDESDAVEDQDVCDMGDARVSEELHLFLSGAHEEEARGVEQLQ